MIIQYTPVPFIAGAGAPCSVHDPTGPSSPLGRVLDFVIGAVYGPRAVGLILLLVLAPAVGSNTSGVEPLREGQVGNR